MPFGRYKGEDLADVPGDYLSWLLSIDLMPWLREAVEQELAYRGAPKAVSQVPPDLQPMVAEIVTRGYRAASMRHHPDRGGSTIGMQRLNAAAEWLREELELR